MTAIAYKSIGNGTFTDALLDTNFQVIGNYTHYLEGYLATLTEHVANLTEAHEALAKKVAKLPKKRRVLPFVVGAGAGIYLYKRLKKSGVEVEFHPNSADLKEQAKKAYAETVRKDVPKTEAPKVEDESFEG